MAAAGYRSTDGVTPLHPGGTAWGGRAPARRPARPPRSAASRRRRADRRCVSPRGDIRAPRWTASSTLVSAAPPHLGQRAAEHDDLGVEEVDDRADPDAAPVGDVVDRLGGPGLPRRAAAITSATACGPPPASRPARSAARSRRPSSPSSRPSRTGRPARRCPPACDRPRRRTRCAPGQRCPPTRKPPPMPTLALRYATSE